MVENAPKPESPVPMPLENPLVPILRMLSQCLGELDNLDFSGSEQMEFQKQFLLNALLREQEGLARLTGLWELALAATQKKPTPE